MIASKHARRLALALLIGGSALLPAVASELAARIDSSAVHAAGKGTIELPDLGGEGLVVAPLLAEDGSRYGFDALLTGWIPSGPAPELMLGGVYGRVFSANGQGPEMKARVEGNWRMVDAGSGYLVARVVQDSLEGERVIGRIEGKFLVEPVDSGADLGDVKSGQPTYSGLVGVDMLLAE